MGWGWTKVYVPAIALVALGGCCPEPAPDQDNERVLCVLSPTNDGGFLAVKGTAEYTSEVTGDAVIDQIKYWVSEPEYEVYVDNPQQPFTVTAELQVNDIFSSDVRGTMTTGSISVRNTFTPADGSVPTVREQTCWHGLPP
jgi:hypothetical protein